MSTANELGLGPLFAGGAFTGRAVVFAGDLTGDVIRGATRQGLSSLYGRKHTGVIGCFAGIEHTTNISLYSGWKGVDDGVHLALLFWVNLHVRIQLIQCLLISVRPLTYTKD